MANQHTAVDKSQIPAPLPRYDRVVVLGGLIAVAAAGWAYTLYDYYLMNNLPMDLMWMPPTGGGQWALMDFWLTFVMWTVMMVAMMTPSAIPMVMVFARVQKNKRARQQPYTSTFIFLAGYLLAWMIFSAGVTLVQWPLHHFAILDPMMDNRNATLAGIILMAAGVFQWTPLKDMCLTHCRSPIGFILHDWKEGSWGAFKMGLHHGLYCTGCCWALMFVLFAVGVMNILWVAIIAVFVLTEKIIPRGIELFKMASGIALFLWGLSLLTP